MMKRLDKLPDGARLIAIRGNGTDSPRLYDDVTGQGFLYNPRTNQTWEVNVQSALARGYWEQPPNVISATEQRQLDAELDNEDWIRRRRWDLPTNYSEFRETLNDQSPEGIAKFLDTPAAQPMPYNILRGCADELEAAVIPVPYWAKERLVKRK